MIDDGLVGIFSLILLLVEALVNVIIVGINLVALVVELVVSLFVSGFTMKRVKRRKRGKASDEPSGKRELIVLGVLAAVILGSWGIPKVIEKEVTFFTPEGGGIPYASIVIEKKNGESETRKTNSDGQLSVPRFGLESLSIKSRRYVEQTWSDGEIETSLTAQPSTMKNVVDTVTDLLSSKMKKANVSGD